MTSFPEPVLQLNKHNKEQICTGLCDDANLSEEKMVLEIESW